MVLLKINRYLRYVITIDLLNTISSAFYIILCVLLIIGGLILLVKD